ncbi:YodC family protein [Pseudomonas sp. TE3911]
MADFSVGDVVTLKSGGPAMTVDSLPNDFRTGEPLVRCTWFDKNDSVQYENFGPALLKAVE